MKIVAITIGLVVAGAGSMAQAATSTGNLSVSAIVSATCSVQNAALPSGNNRAYLAQVGVNCSSGTAYTISLDAGTTASSRQLMSDGSQQNLPLYSTTFSAVPSGQTVSAGTGSDVAGITLSY